jgi:hypothetical protein
VQTAVLETLQYADLFSFPLTLLEIYRYLPAEATLSAVSLSLDELEESGEVEREGDYYVLPGKAEVIAQRIGCLKSSRQKLRKASRVGRVIGILPWIEFIGVTGSLAVENAQPKDDIDLMIITSPNRLWLSRGVVVALLLLSGNYRRSSKIRNRFCTNMWLSLDALPMKSHSPFILHEIAQIRPIFDREGCYYQFLNENSEIYELFPNWVPDESGHTASASGPRYFSKGLNFINLMAYLIQHRYMQRKRISERIEYSRAFFFPWERRFQVERALREYPKEPKISNYRLSDLPDFCLDIKKTL